MEKILFVAHMDSHIANFHIPYLKWFKDQGYEVHVASNRMEQTKEILYCDFKHQIDFVRTPFSLKNRKPYQQMKELLKKHQYALIHVHTPMGALITRLAARKIKTPLLYTAHGFHFYKGAPLLNWLLFYPMERFLLRYTKELITISEEDYAFALKKFGKLTKVSHTWSVGVNLDEFHEVDEMKIEELRSSLGIKPDDFMVTYVGELTNGKNQQFLLDLYPEMIKIQPKTKLVFVGYGVNQEKYKKYVNDEKLEGLVHILGYRKDVNIINNASNLFVSSSLREGLPKSVLEAMAIGKVTLLSDIRGHHELVHHGFNGFLFDSKKKEEFLIHFKEAIKYADDPKMKREIVKTVDRYRIEHVLLDAEKIYQNYLGKKVTSHEE